MCYKSYFSDFYLHTLIQTVNWSVENKLVVKIRYNFVSLSHRRLALITERIFSRNVYLCVHFPLFPLLSWVCRHIISPKLPRKREVLLLLINEEMIWKINKLWKSLLIMREQLLRQTFNFNLYLIYLIFVMGINFSKIAAHMALINMLNDDTSAIRKFTRIIIFWLNYGLLTCKNVKLNRNTNFNSHSSQHAKHTFFSKFFNSYDRDRCSKLTEKLNIFF